MPRIFDNLALGSSLLPALQEALALSSRADFCVASGRPMLALDSLANANLVEMGAEVVRTERITRD